MMGAEEVLAGAIILGVSVILGTLLFPLLRPRSGHDKPDRSEHDRRFVEIENGQGERGWLDTVTGNLVQRGTQRYSPWFGHYVEVVTFRSEMDWSFRVIDDPRYPGVYAALSPFSILPLTGPERIGIRRTSGQCGQTMMPAEKVAEGWWYSLPRGHIGIACVARSTIGTPSEIIERETLRRS